MKLNRQLNIVIGIDDGSRTLHVHSSPISYEVFEKYFLVISKTFSVIYSNGLDFRVGPSVAALTLKKVAQDMDVWEGPDGVEHGLVAEIERLSSVIVPGKGIVPLQQARSQNILSVDDYREVMNIVTFFTVASCVHKKAVLEPILRGAAQIWGAEITCSTCTEYAASLMTSTEEETSTTETLPTYAGPA